MPRMEIDSNLARRQLQRILASSGFAKNGRMGRFLRFVIERHIEGRDDEIKESVLAVEVFGRRPDHDPKRDPIVRTEASRLRARLGEYYANGGAGDPLIIELPKGGYVPVLRQAGAELRQAISNNLRRPTSIEACRPIAGRRGVISDILKIWSAAEHGARQLLLLSGEAGIGKTTVVQEVLSTVTAAGGARATWGQCLQHYGIGEPYQPLLDALMRLCRQPDGAG